MKPPAHPHPMIGKTVRHRHDPLHCHMTVLTRYIWLGQWRLSCLDGRGEYTSGNESDFIIVAGEIEKTELVNGMKDTLPIWAMVLGLFGWSVHQQYQVVYTKLGKMAIWSSGIPSRDEADRVMKKDRQNFPGHDFRVRQLVVIDREFHPHKT